MNFPVTAAGMGSVVAATWTPIKMDFMAKTAKMATFSIPRIRAIISAKEAGLAMKATSIITLAFAVVAMASPLVSVFIAATEKLAPILVRVATLAALAFTEAITITAAVSLAERSEEGEEGEEEEEGGVEEEGERREKQVQDDDWVDI